MHKEGYITYLHSFRGFAILCVIIVHVAVMPIVAYYDFGEPDQKNNLFIINEVLFHASTIYFALISGLLFSAVLRNRGFIKFYQSKFLYIFLPYLFFTMLLSLGRPPEGPDDPGGIHTNLISYLSVVGQNLLLGKALPIYWYLPVLFILYFLTPLLSYIVHAKNALKWLTLPIVLVPFIISRQPIAFGNEFYWQDPVYFIGVYTVGMWIGGHLTEFMDWLERKIILVGLVAVVSTGLLGYLHWSEINIVGITSLRESAHYVHKLAISGLVLVWFKKLSHQPRFMTILANDAFSIYFIHFIPIFIFLQLFVPLIKNESLYPWSILISMLGVFVLTLALTKLIIFIFQKIFGRYSRHIIGS